MKRILSLTLALIMAAGALPGVTYGVAAEEPGGKFLAPIEPITDFTDWIPISDRAGLEAIKDKLNGKYYLTANINLSGEEWAPISGFQGTFDGQGHVIRNMKITTPVGTSNQYAGLFGEVSYISGATIKNVGLENTNIDITSASGILCVGALGGYFENYTAVSNCYNIGTVTSIREDNAGLTHAGGLVGYISNAVDISDCYNEGNVTVEGFNSDVYAGGICGQLHFSIGNYSVSNCFNTGKISAKTNSSNIAYAGGISGYIGGIATPGYNANFGNCRNIGEVYAEGYSAHAGGLFGFRGSYQMAVKISHCENTGAVSATASHIAYAGGFLGDTVNGTSGNIEITDSRSTGNVKAVSTGTEAYAGGLVGFSYGSVTMKTCYATGDITADAATAQAGGLIARPGSSPSPDNCYAIGDLSDEAMKQQDSFEDPNAIRVTVKFYKDNLNGTPDIISFRFTDKEAGDRITPADISGKLGDDWLNAGNTDEGKYGVALVSYPTLTGERGKDVVKVLYMQRTTNS